MDNSDRHAYVPPEGVDVITQWDLFAAAVLNGCSQRPAYFQSDLKQVVGHACDMADLMMIEIAKRRSAR